MSRTFFQQELEGVATFWRIRRTDGVTLGLTSHDRDLWFNGLRHLGSPGMVPSAIRRTADLAADSAEVQGALTHDGIAAADLSAGRFDGAGIEIGLVDWETLESAILYQGTIGGVAEEAGSYSAELQSAKSALEIDPVPRTSPTCRAQFCGPGCTLSPARFTHRAVLADVDRDASAMRFDQLPDPARFVDGSMRWLEGPCAGQGMEIVLADDGWLVVDAVLQEGLAPGMRALLREGCDHTFATCSERFANALNFRGEPFLPGNDVIARYPQGS